MSSYTHTLWEQAHKHTHTSHTSYTHTLCSPTLIDLDTHSHTHSLTHTHTYTHTHKDHKRDTDIHIHKHTHTHTHTLHTHNTQVGWSQAVWCKPQRMGSKQSWLSDVFGNAAEASDTLSPDCGFRLLCLCLSLCLRSGKRRGE